MKFLCDRCKTRYSIGDDRVRGKILKIRCKNCNNVITVREGMLDADAAEAADPGAPRRQKQATQAIDAVTEAQAAGALGAAFASAMTKPPAALEEEWYVSIDGDQSGPFSLAEAQRWVSTKAVDADLHCWSEGFDDWLPVDKVSHFRGLRQRPAPPTAPPPLPRSGSGPVRSVLARTEVEDEPKPLFAATMASLEKAAGGGEAQGFGLPSIMSPPRPAATPLTGKPAIPARANGATAPAIPTPASHARSGSPSSGPARVTGPTGGLGPKLNGAFDASEPGDASTQVESRHFQDEPGRAGDPAGRRQADGNDAFVKAMASGAADSSKGTARSPASLAAAPASVAGSAGSANDHDDDDDDLDIGEVSRVVNLADLARSATRQQAQAAQRRTGAIAAVQPGTLGRVTGPVPKLGGGTGQVSSMTGALASTGQPGDPLIGGANQLGAAPAPAVSHRRGMIALLTGSLLLLGVAIAVVVVVTNNNDGTSGGLGRMGEIDTTRPDDPIRRPGTGAVAVEAPQNPFVPKKPAIKTNPTNTVREPILTNPDAKSLRADEIEEMAAKYSGTTQRCYIRSQRGVDAIIIGDVKKIGVTLTVDPMGAVTDVKLSDHATNSLGKCLIASIRGWKFRASSSGITAKITMVFQSG